MAFDAAPTGLTRRPATSTTPSASPKPTAPRKPAVDGPSRQDGLQAILDFLAGALPSDLFAEVETALEQYVHGSEEPETPRQPAADRRPRFAADASGESSFFERFPAAKKIGAA
ncbi:MAG: hypothetical protein CTY36_02740 [Methylocystis sp.]|nr:MAG: hypothetical protein CTY36_02740 [Methylocystis sp.]